MNTRRALVAGLGVATLGGLVGRRAAAEPEHARHGGTRAAALPNIPLVTHEGKAVTFYDDLIRGKVVAINMMYAECEGICPLATSNLVRVQKLLGERVGRDVFLYSLTLQPELDTPQRLQEYVVMHGVKPGWLFLTGSRADIERLRYRLGFFDPNPVVDGDKATHTGMVRIGNDGYDRWTRRPRWPCLSRSWRPSTTWTAPAGTRAAATRDEEEQGIGLGAGHAACPRWS